MSYMSDQKVYNEYSWYPRLLSPNDRSNWAKKSIDFKKYKNECYWLTSGKIDQSWEFLRVIYKFFPPDKRKRDLDNCYAACKALTDGFSARLGFDDSIIKSVILIKGDSFKNGRITVELSQYVRGEHVQLSCI